MTFEQHTRLPGWSREPLLVFVLIAAGIFVIDHFLGSEDQEAGELLMVQSSLQRIEVSDQVKTMLREEFDWLEGRPPSQLELDERVDEWLEEEVVFRHALLQEMHLNDGKMREHLIEKMRLLWVGVVPDPEENDLLDYYLEHMPRYYSEPRISFDQIFFTELPDDGAQLLKRLQDGEEVKGDDYWLGMNMQNYAESILKNTFGGGFYKVLREAPLNEWTGPLASPRGFHYVRVSGRQDSAPLAYENIRSRVRNDWESAWMRNEIDQRTQALMADFTVVGASTDE